MAELERYLYTQDILDVADLKETTEDIIERAHLKETFAFLAQEYPLMDSPRWEETIARPEFTVLGEYIPAQYAELMNELLALAPGSIRIHHVQTAIIVILLLEQWKKSAR